MSKETAELLSAFESLPPAERQVVALQILERRDTLSGTSLNSTALPKLEIVKGSSNLDMLIPVIAHAIGVFGDEQKTAHWLTTPLPLFENRSPTEVLARPGGLEQVEQTLTRIEHNIPS